MIRDFAAAGLMGVGLLLQAPETASAQDIEAGKAVAQANCAPCHAIGLTGASPLKEAPPFRDIIKRYPVENLEEAFAEGIAVGHRAMPEFRFAPDTIGDLLSYLDSLGE